MKSGLAKIITVLIVGGAFLNTAFAADTPACPKIGSGKTPEFNDVFRNPAGNGWVVTSKPMGAPWSSLFVTIFDRDVSSEEMALERGRQILASLPTIRPEAVELKQHNTDGSYYFACYYPISIKYVGYGDYLGTVSDDYPSDHGASAAKLNAHPGFDKFVRAHR